jgi:aerobic-type carbon monoxide dehydrogenase small subunit (CoxS/CutS family)
MGEGFMADVTVSINGQSRTFAADPQMPLLWALRDLIGLRGTKYTCGIGACGACTVLVDGTPVRSCSAPLSGIDGDVTTIEGISADGTHAVQQAWLAEQVAQCGYCQPGQIMTAVALLAAHPTPTDDDIDAAFAGVLCRCGTYQRIRRAVHRAAGQ